MIIFDSTFTRLARADRQPAWDEPVLGASFCCWLSGSVVIPWSPPKYIPQAKDLLRVIDAVLARRGFPVGTDVFKAGPPPYWSRTNFGPKATPHSFQMDFELSYLANASPDYYAQICTAIRTKHPAIRLLTYAPGALAGFDDNPLKKQLWTPTKDILDAAGAHAKRHAAWINQLWAITVGSYFGAPQFDKSTIWLTYNLVKLARAIFPNRRIVVQVGGARNTAWWKAGGDVSSTVSDDLAGIVRSAHPDGVIIWGPRPSNLQMLKSFGVGASYVGLRAGSVDRRAIATPGVTLD